MNIWSNRRYYWAAELLRLYRGKRKRVKPDIYDMVICMDSSISSTAFMEHLLSLFPRPASCMTVEKGEEAKKTN